MGLFFSGFHVLCFFVCKVAKVFKNAFFPSFGGFCGVGYSCLFGFGRFRCLVFLCLFFFFCFGFVLFGLLCFCSVVGLFLVLVVVLLLFFFFFNIFLFFLFFSFFLFLFVVCFLFFGGFKGQVRWPKGPPHLALNPPYVICFLFCFVFLFLFFFSGEGLRVR